MQMIRLHGKAQSSHLSVSRAMGFSVLRRLVFLWCGVTLNEANKCGVIVMQIFPSAVRAHNSHFLQCNILISIPTKSFFFSNRQWSFSNSKKLRVFSSLLKGLALTNKNKVINQKYQDWNCSKKSTNRIKIISEHEGFQNINNTLNCNKVYTYSSHDLYFSERALLKKNLWKRSRCLPPSTPRLFKTFFGFWICN